MPKNIITPNKDVYILAGASVVGTKESEGPLGAAFDVRDTSDDKFGSDTWEKAESEMQRKALETALAKSKLTDADLDLLLAGDLLNQCVGSNYGLISFDVPYVGLYGACSTCAEGLMLSSVLCGSSVARCASVCSSHNCSAERQFRFPLEYGGQRPPTAQWTVTGAGAMIVTSEYSDFAKINCKSEYIPRVADVLPGCALDYGITDMGNMGAAMAPAAADTILRYFHASSTEPENYDLIVTGDLGAEGASILCELLADSGYPVGGNYRDCGLMIYDREAQDVHAGGSGCGCSGVVFSSVILSKLRTGEVKNVLFIGTGALMSPMSIQQGNSIPGIWHLVHVTAEKYPH